MRLLGDGRRLGAGDGQSQMLGLFQQTGQNFILNNELNPIADEQALLSLIDDIKSGNWSAAAEELTSIGTTILSSAIGGPVGLAIGAFFAGIEAIEFQFGGGDTKPCTVPGCEGAFNLPTCTEPNPFDWGWLGSQFEYVPPQGSNSYFLLGPTWGGAAGMLDWGSNDWRKTSGGTYDWTSPTIKGGPGSFEQALEYAMLNAWQATASSPGLCALIKAAKADGNVNPSAGGGDLVTNVRRYLMAQSGALIPAMVVAWNASHTTGTLSAEVACTQATCEAAGGTWFGPGDCGKGGQTLNCTQTTAAPQRKIAYTVGAGVGNYVINNDPLQLAFDGLAALSGIPAGATISVLVNSGPASLPAQYHVPPVKVINPRGATPSVGGPSALAIIGGTVVVAAVAAGGFSLWAYLTGQAQSEAWQRLGREIWDQSAKSGEHLVAANPLKGARLLGAGEPDHSCFPSGLQDAAEKKSMKVQSLLFPKSGFTKAQARAWAKAHHYKAAKVEGDGQYHRVRQFSPAKATVLRTIPFGGSGIKAVVAR